MDYQGLGFLKDESNYGKGVIIGFVDTGIWPDHPSFRDEGIPSPPAKWKGKCEFNGTVCNNKLTGARNCVHGGDNTLPSNEVGHQTHKGSTAAGNFVKGANVFGNANGTAVEWLLMPTWPFTKFVRTKIVGTVTFLAAIDATVDDGVDVISISMVSDDVKYTPFYADVIAVGAFGETQKGIFVSYSASNASNEHNTLSNEAPWVLTIGASTIDRSIKAIANLGNGAEYDGESLFQSKDFHTILLPLIYAGSNGNLSFAFCDEGSLKHMNVKGKIVMCDRGGGITRTAKGKEVRSAGGAAMIQMDEKRDGSSTLADPHVLPATHVSHASGLNIKAYINSTRNPKATILFKGTMIGKSTIAPAVTSISSRGPSKASPGMLKPDIIGPGASTYPRCMAFFSRSHPR